MKWNAMATETGWMKQSASFTVRDLFFNLTWGNTWNDTVEWFLTRKERRNNSTAYEDIKCSMQLNQREGKTRSCIELTSDFNFPPLYIYNVFHISARPRTWFVELLPQLRFYFFFNQTGFTPEVPDFVLSIGDFKMSNDNLGYWLAINKMLNFHSIAVFQEINSIFTVFWGIGMNKRGMIFADWHWKSNENPCETFLQALNSCQLSKLWLYYKNRLQGIQFNLCCVTDCFHHTARNMMMWATSIHLWKTRGDFLFVQTLGVICWVLTHRFISGIVVHKWSYPIYE